MTTSNIEKVQQIYAAIGRGDLPFVLDQMADDVTWGIDSVATADVPAHGILHGKASVPRFFAGWADTGAFTRFETDDFVAAGDHVFNQLRYEFTVAATGKTVKNVSIQHWTFAHGKLIRWRGYEDTAATRDAYRR